MAVSHSEDGFMKLKKLLKGIPDITVKGSKEIEITGLTANSKVVYPGNLFIVKKGGSFDGHDFVSEAVQTGAAAVLTDLFDPTLKSVTQIIHKNPAALEGILASQYYQAPSQELFMVGITGTNGKTTSSYLVRHLLQELGVPCGLLGTIEYLVGPQRYSATHTTTDAITNHKLLREMCLQGCKAAVMEVTSHGLVQGRVAEISYDVALFTNLTQDHLDYHKDMASYCAAKRKLFQQLARQGKGPRLAVVNGDDSWTDSLLQGLDLPTLTYGLGRGCEVRADDLKLGAGGTSFTVRHGEERVSVEWKLIGRFNVYNYLGAVAVGLAYGASLKEITEALGTFHAVQGRLEPVENSLGIHLFVDFAHTEDALENTLKTLHEVKEGRLITVFGCGGDRDRGKRPRMAAVAEKYAEFVVVTSDNPRSEDPQEICNEVITGLQNPGEALVEVDRRTAISQAVALAKPNDTVLIAGKGHETYQQFARERIDFDDRIVAKECCDQLLTSGVS